MKSSHQRYRFSLLVITLSVSVLTLYLFAGALSKAQSTQQETKELPPWEVKVVGAQRPTQRAAKVDLNAMTGRLLEVQIPFHLPIKVELSNYDKEPLLRNLEVKVTNTGTKPIYFLYLDILLPKTISPAGGPLAFDLVYGRMEFLELDEKIQSDDVPLRPGESCVLKTPENQVGAFEKIEGERNYFHSDIKLAYLSFNYLNFGDGTAYTGAQGTPLPNVRSNRTSNNSCQPIKNREPAGINVTGYLSACFPDALFSHLSAPISSVKISASSLKPPPLTDLCCHGPTNRDCSFRKDSTYTCPYCGTGRITESASCNDPLGVCSDDDRKDRTCTDSAGNTGICVQYVVDECPPPFPGCFNVFQIPPSAPDMFCDYCCGESPIIVDVRGNGYNLTSAQGGVNFDLNNDSVAEHLSWTAADSDDAFLALDRNGNGTIDNGTEVFGNFSPQPRSDNPNGFASLAEFDLTANGGNNDGAIDSNDAIFAALRLWQDINHNGISEANELHTVAESQVVSFSLHYKETPFRDRYGNRFRYVASLTLDSDNRNLRGRAAWDVYLIKG